MINNGEYIPTVNDPTYISNPIEERGFTPSNLRDGNLTTSYKPDNKDGEITEGHLTYRLSEKTNVRKVTIVQDGSSISNAIVKARVGADEWVELGTLSNSLNEFINRDHENIFEIKVEWNGVVPNIYELITLNDEFEFPVSDSLKSKYDALMALNSEDYTISSYAILAEELEELENEFYGKDIKLNGRVTTGMALFLGHKLAHVCKTVGIFDPKLNRYVLTIKH